MNISNMTAGAPSLALAVPQVYCRACGAAVLRRLDRRTRAAWTCYEYFAADGARLYDCPGCGAVLSTVSTTVDRDQVHAVRTSPAAVVTVASVSLEVRRGAVLERLERLHPDRQAAVLEAFERLLRLLEGWNGAYEAASQHSTEVLE